MEMKEAYFYEKLDNDKVVCKLCPHNCIIGEGKLGLCRVRKNIGGSLYSLNYGEITALSLDPIEKKPLFHFYPSSNILSVGTWGCNLTCQWCQNWQISQQHPSVKKLYPEELLKIALQNKDRSIGVAFTYSEPSVFFEYIKDFLDILKFNNLKVVLVTNGYINIEPLREIIPYVDAFNIDVKVYDEKISRLFTSAFVEKVKETVKFIYGKSHLELTTLVVPTINDDLKQFEEECKWIASISKDIPLHISRYYPSYKFNASPTSLETLNDFYEVAKSYLDYVYVGNAYQLGLENTYCPECGALLIERNGYDVKFVNYEKGKCTKCGKTIIKNTF